MSGHDLAAAGGESVARLESRAAITDLVHRYAYNIRAGNPVECEALFIEDAVFEIRETDPVNPADTRVRTSLTGRRAILDYIVQAAGSGVRVCPLIHNLLIELDGDTAESRCMMTTRSWPAGHEMIGEYCDSYRRESGWRFASRVYTIYKSSPVGS